MLTNLFLKTKAQPYIPGGMFSEILNSTLIALSKFFCYLITKTYKLYSISLSSLEDLKSVSDIYG